MAFFYAIHELEYDLLLLAVKLRSESDKSSQLTAKEKLNNMDALLKYKKLLDSGAITQEEFDRKKKELLGK